MARYFKYLLLLTSSIFLLSSCQEGREAGDLFGQWEMSGNNSLYIAFSGSVTVCRNNIGDNVYGTFQHMGDSLFIQFYSIYGEKTDTTLIEESYGLKPFNNIRVKIAALDNDELVITKGSQTWSFYKY